MADFLLSVGVDVGLSYDQMQKDISDLVTRLNQNPQRVRVGLEIDHSAIERFRTEVANIHNSMGGLGRVTVSPVDTGGLNNAIDGITRLAQSTQGAISTVQTMRAELNSVNSERIQQAIASINGISSEGASALARSLGEANVRATEVRARLLEAADAEQQLVALQVRGTNEAGHMVNYLMTYNTETGEISRRMVDITARLEDATAAESHRATTVREITDLYRQMHALMRTNANAADTASYAELANQAQLLQDALALARTESISVDEALTRLGTTGATAINGARDAMSAFRLEMEQTGSSGTVNLTTMYNTVAQMQNLLNNNAGYANLATYTNLQTQVNLLAQAIELASNGGMTLEAALTAVGLNGSTAVQNAREAMSAFRAEMSGATAEEERLTMGTAHYQTALDKINTLLRQVRANTEKWTAAKTGKSSADYQVYADQARELENLAQRLSTGTITMREFNAEYSRIRSTASGAETSIKAAGEATQTWTQRVGKLTEKFGTWFSITRVIMAAYRAVREMVSAVVDLDTAMTELKKVTDETDATYERFLNNAATRAKQLGATMSDIVTASADFARLGYTIGEAESLADAAIVYKNVGDGIEDINAASESIIATMQAFGVEATDVMSIVDKFNEVGNNYAISSKGVGDALLRSAAAMKAANNTLDESIALATAANTIVQDPDKVGTAMKTVSMYLRAAKTEAEDAGESTEGMADSVSELRKEILSLTGNKVDIQINEDEFKSTYQILKELSEVWGELSDISQANILEMVGGKRNSNIVAAMLENFTIAEKALQTSMSSVGSAFAENEKYLDSINGKVAIFKATFEDFSQNLISSDFVKDIVDLGTGLLNILNIVAKLIDIFGGLNTILYTTLSIITVIKAEVILTSIWGFITGIVTGILKLGTTLKSVGAAIKVFIAMTKASRNASAGAMMVYGQSTGVLGRLSAAFNAVGISASTAQIAVAAFMIVLTALILVIQAVNKAQEEAEQKAAEIRQQNIQAAQTAATMSDELSTLINRYIELNDVVGVNSSNIEQLISTKDDLIDKLDIEQEKLDELIKKYGSYSDAVKQATVDKLKDAERDLRGGLNSYEDEVISAAKPEELKNKPSSLPKKYKSNLVHIWSYALDKITDGSVVDQALKALQNDSRFKVSYGNNAVGSGLYTFQIAGMSESDLGDVDNVIKAYNLLGEALDVVEAKVGSDNEIYDDLYAQYSAVAGAISNYKGAIGNLNSNLAEQYMLSGLIGQEIPKTKESFDTYKQGVVDAAVASGEFVGSEREIEVAIDNVLKQQPQFMNFYENIADGSADGVAGLNDLSEALQKLKSAYSVLETAQTEMATGGLSADTIKALADETEDYLDYLYEENGLIKLNVDAWKERANLEMEGNISAIEAEIASLEKERETIQANLTEWENKDGRYRSKQEMIAKYTAELDANTAAIEANQAKLGIYNSLYNSVAGALDAYSAQLQNFTNVANAITSVSDSLTTVADLQETVANGFTISLEKALEFAKVYPEILNGATVAADGQISLNEGIVNAFIEGKEAELKAQIDAEVAKLEADKAVLTAKMEFSKAQLELAKSVGTGEGQISKEVAEYRVNAGNAVAQALIAAGIDEATAYQLACAAMAQNSEEFNRVAAEVCTDVQGNFNQAAYDAAQAIYTNMQNSKLSIASVAAQAHEAAKAIAGIASGTVQGSSSVQGGGAGGSYTGKGNISVHSGSFKGTEYTYEAKTISLEDFISDLELDISNYQQAISQIDGQIATLKALRNTSLNKFSTSNKNASKGSGSKSGSSKDDEPTWFEKEYALHQHLLKMDAENVEDYLDWLNSAYQRAYKEGIIDLDDYYKYQEEVYTGLQDLFKDYLNDVEHEISMRENYEGESDKIIELYKKLMKDVEKEIAAARAQGLDDTDDYIQELQKKWQGYAESVKDIQEDATESAKDAVAELVDYRIDMIKQDIENEKDALDKKLDYLKEFYDKQKDMLQDQYDEEQYLKEQAEKRKSVSDLRSEIAMLENDDSAWAQKRKLELQEELATAEDDLGTFEDEHALDLALDALDNAYNAQEAQIQAEMDALEEKLNDPEALYNQALTEIKNNTGNLYQEMLEYNRKHGTGNDEDVKDIYEEAYKALLEYKDIYGKDYEGVVLTNSTNYKPGTGSWDTEKISGTNPNNQPKEEPKKEEPKKEEPKNTAPSLSKGSTITVKKSATHFGSKSNGVRMASFVPGGSYTVYQTSGNQVLIGRNGVYTGWINKSDIVGYAKGTKNATAGLHSLDELGSEYLFTSTDGNKYRVLSSGDKVLNARATDFLYEFANGGGEILEKIIKSAMGTSLFDKIAPSITNNEINMGDIVIQGNAGSKTVSEIRREQRDSISYMLKELNRLNKA